MFYLEDYTLTKYNRHHTIQFLTIQQMNKLKATDVLNADVSADL